MKAKLLICKFALLLSLSLEAKTLEIIKIGHPTLRATAQELSLAEIESLEIQELAKDMASTMKSAGGVGLAAPQINRSIRMFVMGMRPTIPLTVVINPRIEYLEEFGQTKSQEGCLSIPGKTMVVKRFKKIHLSYFNLKGEYISKKLSGMSAIIAQHEYDHLNGVLIVDLVEEMMSKINFSQYVKTPLM